MFTGDNQWFDHRDAVASIQQDGTLYVRPNVPNFVHGATPGTVSVYASIEWKRYDTLFEDMEATDGS